MVNATVRRVNKRKESPIAEFLGFGNLYFVRGVGCGLPGTASWPPEAKMAGLHSWRPASQAMGIGVHVTS